MNHRHTSELHLNNSTHPVHIIIMIHKHTLMRTELDEEMTGTILGIDQEIMAVVIDDCQAVPENVPIHLHRLPHLLVHLDRLIHVLILLRHQVDQDQDREVDRNVVRLQ